MQDSFPDCNEEKGGRPWERILGLHCHTIEKYFEDHSVGKVKKL